MAKICPWSFDKAHEPYVRLHGILNTHFHQRQGLTSHQSWTRPINLSLSGVPMIHSKIGVYVLVGIPSWSDETSLDRVIAQRYVP